MIITDQNDESLNRWKASLGLSTSPPIAVDPNDTRRCVIKSLGLEVAGRSDVIIDLASPGSLETLRAQPFTIKEGAEFRMKAQFVVQHDVLSGLKYLQVVKRKGVRVSKNQEMIVRPLSLLSWRCLLSSSVIDRHKVEISCFKRPLKLLVFTPGFLRTEHTRKAHLRKEM